MISRVRTDDIVVVELDRVDVREQKIDNVLARLNGLRECERHNEADYNQTNKIHISSGSMFQGEQLAVYV
jgi:hypothetical protein